MRKRSKPETVLQARIVAALKLAFPRAKVLRMNSGGVQKGARHIELAPKGFPDIMVLLPNGRVVFLEVKTRDGSCSDEQLQWEIFFSSAGIPHRVVRTQQEAIDFIARCM